jgi:hypothetical protein
MTLAEPLVADHGDDAPLGARFELGTGVSVTLPEAAELQALADAVSAGTGQDADPDVTAAGTRPQPPSADVAIEHADGKTKLLVKADGTIEINNRTGTADLSAKPVQKRLKAV